MVSQLNTVVNWLTYGALLGVASWGAFCCVMVWRRVAQKRFKREDAQNEFLDAVETVLSKGDFDSAAGICDGDPRALPQLALLAILNRELGFAKVRHLVQDRFERDVLADLENRLTWVHTVIKAAPMLGLFGTVFGMMGAFGKLATFENVKADQLASDISFALVTTACGLSIAIPLILAVASINIRIRKMEELVAAGLNRFLEALHAAMTLAERRR